ncbi:formate dehydrogenase accessory protein FdhE domain-containing protein [Desulfosporosinus nitroreducens]|uniref:Formate dehydrogenase accessory protein FdhE n=1 Tax=Desulfosporosinus nitroreducens TaxID=2018668 RepID=A0ABT8QQL6_9FIRM|nr:formate dehydrogenase accessory protein FdhE [Desulfosporosinus nitroreducens]MCO1603969.1 formate dehydrogenase accessory protein FdhE [Desulfosporosinus nitroreducens]MDO0822799.1 formate dehydrogenase accessory protein FdhE [Desulfosporosinus nitroreducens]
MIGVIMMDNAFQTYRLLKEEVKRWQDERGSFWINRLSPAKVPPYYPIKELPEKAVLELCQRLNKVSNILVSESMLRDAWNKFMALKPVKNNELLSRLQIALCGVAQLYRNKIVEVENSSKASTHSMTCPICGELAGVSVLSPPNGNRFVHCSICGHEWTAKRVGCIRCGSEEASMLTYLQSDEFPGVEMIVCKECWQYSKEYDLRVLSTRDIDWETIRTLSLDYAAEKWLSEHARLLESVH